jgi:2'-5' RNA ligase
MPESDNLRLFIALELPAEITDALEKLQKRLRDLDRERSVRWVTLDSVHLTLKFLGDTPPDRVPAIEAAIVEAATNHKPFSLSIDGAGCFPNLQKPRIVWAGAGGDLNVLHALRDAVERTVSPLGYPTESRPFNPHLTLGRARQEASRSALSDLGEKIGSQKIGTLATWQVQRVSLMRSELKQSGAVYTRLAETSLNARD